MIEYNVLTRKKLIIGTVVLIAILLIVMKIIDYFRQVISSLKTNEYEYEYIGYTEKFKICQ